jgi:hypothetical protein
MTFINEDQHRHPVMIPILVAAAMLHQRVSTTRRYCREGLLDSVVLGNKRLVRQDSVYRLLAEGSAGVKARRNSIAAFQASAQSAAPSQPKTAVPQSERLFSVSDLAYIRDYQDQLTSDDRQIRVNARWQLDMFFKTASARAALLSPESIDPASMRILASLTPLRPTPAVAPASQAAPAPFPAPAPTPAPVPASIKSDLDALKALAARSQPPTEPESFEAYTRRVQTEKLATLREALKSAPPDRQAAYSGWDNLKAG